MTAAIRFAIAPYDSCLYPSELMQPLPREIGQLGSSFMIPIVKWFTDRIRSVCCVKRMAAPRWAQLRCGPFVFVLGELLCAVSIARLLWCASLSFLSPP
jgi:hypothetical protein